MIILMYILTGLTMVVDITALTIMWIKNNEILKNIERHLTNKQEEIEML